MDKYILDEMDKLNQLAHSGAEPDKVLEGLKKIEELISKNELMKQKINDPVRTASMEFGDKEPEKEILPREIDLQPFGTPEEPINKGIGNM